MSLTPITREATGRSPEVSFDFPRQHLRIRGKSYPEDAVAFYGPLLNALKEWLPQQSGTQLTVDICLLYFNSSSAKALMNLLMLLDTAAQRNNDVTINWHYLQDDETMQEYGEEFAEDLQHAKFQLVPAAEI